MTLSLLAVLLCAGRALAGRRTGFAVDAAIVAVAVAAWHDGAGPLLQPRAANVPLYVLAAIVIFTVSAVLTTTSRKHYFSRRVRLHAMPWRQLAGPVLLAPLHEELIWRVLLQSLIAASLGAAAALAVVAAGFTAWHRERLAGDARQLAEFGLFSLTLGAVFAISRDPLAVLTIHVVRNLLILSIQPEHASA